MGAAIPEDSTLVAYLIDTITGRILHRVSHPNMQGPVHAVSNTHIGDLFTEFIPRKVLKIIVILCLLSTIYRSRTWFLAVRLVSNGALHLQVVSENWVVYHYFNLRQHRYEMSVLELYDQSRLVLFPPWTTEMPILLI